MKHLLFALLILFPFIISAEETPAKAPGGPDNPGADTNATPGSPPTGEATEDAEPEFLKRSATVVAKIRGNKRQMDPFGLPMDPTNAVVTPVLADQYDELEEVPTLNNTSLKSALSNLPISGIYPGKKMIVLGARSFQPGEEFGMKLEELTIRLRFEGIKGSSVFFKDMDTQEVATVDFNTKPKEFEPIVKGTTRDTPNGIEPMNDLFIVN